MESKEFFQTCASSLLARSKVTRWQTWRLKWKRDFWIRHLFGRIVKPSQQNHLRVEEWIYSLLHTHVNHFQQPENGKAQKMKDTCGRIAGNLSKKQTQESVFLKTSRDTSPLDSEKSLPIWLSSDTGWKQIVANQRGDYSRRLSAAHRTRGNECLYWRTATAEDSTNRTFACNNRGEPKLSAQVKIQNWGTPRVTTNGGHPSPQCTGKGSRLEDQAAMWQTPEAQNQTGYQNQRGWSRIERLGTQVLTWPTPASRDHKGQDIPSRNGGASLSHFVQTGHRTHGQPVQESTNTHGKSQEYWPTAQARDHRTGSQDRLSRPQKNLNDKVLDAWLTPKTPTGGPEKRKSKAARCSGGECLQTKANGNLNPAWVEQLMGLEVGWTDLGSWGMESSQQRQKKHSQS